MATDTARAILSKVILPTHLNSAEIKEQLAAEIRRRAFFSATTHNASYLKKLQELCTKVATGIIDQATARKHLQKMLDNIGYKSEETGLTNLASKARLDLVLDTQRQMAHSIAQLKGQTPEDLAQYPGWTLERYEGRIKPRSDWPARWKAAGDSVGWKGASKTQMTALKDSPIWKALGDGAGGFKDTLDNPYPPFAFRSGLNWTPVSREDCQKLGLFGTDEAVKRPKAPTLSPGEQEIADALQKLGKGFESALLKELRG